MEWLEYTVKEFEMLFTIEWFTIELNGLTA